MLGVLPSPLLRRAEISFYAEALSRLAVGVLFYLGRQPSYRILQRDIKKSGSSACELS